MADEGFMDVNIRGRIIQVPRPQTERDTLRERFRKVILLAGYTRPEIILDEYFDKYMENIPEFVRMMEEYEERYKEDGEIV
jgi:hypothetical protein